MRDSEDGISPRARKREDMGPCALSDVRGGVSSGRTVEAERDLAARTFPLPVALPLVEALSSSGAARAFCTRVAMMKVVAEVAFRGVDVAEAKQLSGTKVSVSGVRRPIG